ncbi:MAG: DUF2281 domain-containing protein [bacterium]
MAVTRRETVIRQLESMPDNYLDEVSDFLQFLQTRIGRDGLATAVASESSLRKDWLRPEEDEAWKDL